MKNRHQKRDEEQQEEVSNDVEIASFTVRLRISKHDLDTEVSEQAVNYEEVADRYAHAVSNRDLAKDHLKNVEAALDHQVREDAPEGTRLTEKMVESMVQLHIDRRKAFKRLVQADYEVNKWQGLRDSWRDRSFMLRELCALHISAYSQQTSVSSSDLLRKEADANLARQKMAEARKQRAR